LITAWILMLAGNGLLLTSKDDYDVSPSMPRYLVVAGLGTGIACASCPFGGGWCDQNLPVHSDR